MHLSRRDVRLLECSLLILTLGLTCLLYQLDGYKMVVLNLFYLPVVLGAFFLGRYRAGILALFCVLVASAVAALQLNQLAVTTSPLTTALSVAVWGAVLGMTALLAGTLSDERTRKSHELHEAYVGVVEVLAQYLQSGNPRMKARSIRIAELSQRIAAALKLPPQQTDDIRVAALLHDMTDVEITAKVIRRAMGSLQSEGAAPYTFQGKDLVISLGGVLSGAMPLLQAHQRKLLQTVESGPAATAMPIGAQIIHTVRQYDELIQAGGGEADVDQVLQMLRRDAEAAGTSSAIVDALQQHAPRFATQAVAEEAPAF